MLRSPSIDLTRHHGPDAAANGAARTIRVASDAFYVHFGFDTPPHRAVAAAGTGAVGR